MRVYPLSRLELVQRHRAYLEARTSRLLEWVAILVWALALVDSLSLGTNRFEDWRQIRSDLFLAITSVLTAQNISIR
jgi:hypothetical protein